MSSAPGSPGLRRRCASRGGPYDIVVHEAAPPGRRTLPVLLRPGARDDDRQWQSFAAVGQPRCAGVSRRDRGRESIDGASASGFRFHRPRNHGAMAIAPKCRAVALVDFLIPSAGAGHAPGRLSSSPAPSCPGQGQLAIGEVMRCDGSLYERLWRPFFLAALNTEPGEGSSPPCRRRGAGNPRQGRAGLPSLGCAPRPVGGLHRSGTGRFLAKHGVKIISSTGCAPSVLPRAAPTPSISAAMC